MAEFAFKKDLFTNAIAEKDRRGVHKPGDCVGFMPDGWSSNPNWAAAQESKDFAVVRCPGITMAEAQAASLSRPWKDDLDYEVIAERPTQGEYDIRIFEKNAGAINQNAIVGIKATRVRDYLLAWGCSNFALSETDGSFTFSLWDAVRSKNFWNVPLIGSKVSFSLNSYNSQTGIGDITATLLDETIRIADAARKIEEQGGVVGAITGITIRFTINRSDILTRFKADVKRRLEQIYKRHQYSISQSDLDAIIAAGGIVTVSRSVFLAKIIDHLVS